MVYDLSNHRFLEQQWCQVWVSSCRPGLKSKLTVVGYSCHLDATVWASVGMCCQASHYFSFHDSQLDQTDKSIALPGAPTASSSTMKASSSGVSSSSVPPWFLLSPSTKACDIFSYQFLLSRFGMQPTTVAISYDLCGLGGILKSNM